MHLLDNIFWHALVGPHAKYAVGAKDARRYAAGFSPIVGFADAERPDLDALAQFCGQDEHFYCGGWSGPAPAGWRIELESTMHCMIREVDNGVTDEAPDAVRLGSQHASLAAVAPRSSEALQAASTRVRANKGDRTCTT